VTGNALTERRYPAGYLTAGRLGDRRGALILALAHEDFGIGQPGGLDVDEELTGARDGFVDLVEAQDVVRIAELMGSP
jgi:hypothetical protein